MEEMQRLPILGDKLPFFEVQTTHGMMKLPADIEGSWAVLFSHPADFTPVCTTEFVGFQKRIDDFEKLGVKLIGLSIDQVFSHIKWVDWIKENLKIEITFPIIADDGAVAKALGMVHPSKGSNTVRAVFVIDPKGQVRLVLYYPQEIGRNIDEILRAIKAMQISDENGVAMPANWPKSELLEDRVIIPPAKDVDTARKRMAENKCYDWWFCHKKL